jgi:SNF2 family DNA or RNA helicase
LDDFSSEKKVNKLKCSECEATVTIKSTSAPKSATKKFNFKDTRVFKNSTKLNALVEQLKELAPTGDKSIVFSQFTSFLDLVEVALKHENIEFVRLDGSMTHTARSVAIETFKADSTINVFLISLKAGGVGLNLTEANRVFMLDPWWNVSFKFIEYFFKHVEACN